MCLLVVGFWFLFIYPLHLEMAESCQGWLESAEHAWLRCCRPHRQGMAALLSGTCPWQAGSCGGTYTGGVEGPASQAGSGKAAPAQAAAGTAACCSGWGRPSGGTGVAGLGWVHCFALFAGLELCLWNCCSPPS